MAETARGERVMSGRLKQIRSFSGPDEAEEVGDTGITDKLPPLDPKVGDKKNVKSIKMSKNAKSVAMHDENAIIQTYKAASMRVNQGSDKVKEKKPRKHSYEHPLPVKMQGPPTPATKARYHRQVMDTERARAAVYRKTIGRRNALDFGRRIRGNGNDKKTRVVHSRPFSVMENDSEKLVTPDNRAKSSFADYTDSEAEVDRIHAKNAASGSSLTKRQIKAFKEVFDLFDRNGGGTIDANELNETLQSVDIKLTSDEIQEVLKVIDEDGNGEIDFEEFLCLMTNTERFIEAITEKKSETTEKPGQETLLFDALTEFMKKSALHSMDEIVDYFSHKYKKTKTPHVVNHYAAGARLIGLTERQLKEHLEHLKASRVVTGTNNKFLKNSPYAMPLHIITSSTNVPSIPRMPKPGHRGRIKLFVKQEAENEPDGNLQNTAGGPLRGVNLHHDDTRSGKLGCQFLNWNGVSKLHHLPIGKRGFGWVSQHTDHIEVSLKCQPLKKLMPFPALTAEDLPAIRTNVEEATVSYTRERRRAQLVDNYKHWNALEAGLISPPILQDHFRGTYSIYSLVAKRLLNIP